MQKNVNLKIDYVDIKAARWACEHWHYSKCVPAGKIIKIGVWEDERFIGVVLFSRGANNNLGSVYHLDQTQCCELTRIALRDHKSFVSEIMIKAIKKLKDFCPNMQLIVSFADPEQGHNGAIYQATNWIYAGKSQSAVEYIVNGKRMHGRSLRATKPNNLTSSEYAKQLDPNFKRIHGSAKHRYLFPLNKKLKKELLKYSLPYPKKTLIEN